MKKDSTVVDFGGIVIKEVTETSDSAGHLVKTIERNSEHPFMHYKPVLGMYFVIVFTLVVLISFIFWYYLRSKMEIAKMMIQNNMQPTDLFRIGNKDEKSIGGALKYGIVCIAIGIAFVINFGLQKAGLRGLQAPVLLISIGICLLIINRLKKKD